MKIAAVITGHMRGGMRNFFYAYPNFFNLFGKNLDVYISTWDKQESGLEIEEDHLNPWREDTNLVNYKIHDLEKYNKEKELYKLDYDRKYDIEDICKMSKHEVFSKFSSPQNQDKTGTHAGFTNEAIEYWVNRIKDQYYMVRRSFDLIHDYEKYNIIIRLRFDYKFLTPFMIAHTPRAFLSQLNHALTVASNTEGNMHYDCIQYGIPKIMNKYFLLYDHIDNFVDDLCYKNRLSYDTFNAENMMKYYMEEYGNEKYKIYMEPTLREHVNFILERG